MVENLYEKLKRAIIEAGVNTIEEVLDSELDYDSDEEMLKSLDEVLKQLSEEEMLKLYNKYYEEVQMVRLNITMAYTYVGNTGIDIPLKLLKGKTETEKLQIAYDYAKEHIDEIPVADHVEYISDSDNFQLEDISW